MGRENEEVGRCQLAIGYNFYVLPALSSQLSVFSKFHIMNTLLHFLLLCQSCRRLRNVSLSKCILGLIKSAYYVCLSMMTSSEGPLFSLASGPPNPKPTTAYTNRSFHYFYLCDRQTSLCCSHNAASPWANHSYSPLATIEFPHSTRFMLPLNSAVYVSQSPRDTSLSLPSWASLDKKDILKL